LQSPSLSLAQQFAGLRPEARALISKSELGLLEHSWRFWARPEQLAPAWDWSTWLILAGRGFGKTRAGAEWVREQVNAGARRIALVGRTAGDVRDVMIEGESGILAVFPAGERPKYEPSRRQITFHNGAVAKCYSDEEPDQLRGPQHDRAWCDEVAAWRHVERSLADMRLGLRLGSRPRALYTTTPRPLPFLRELVQKSRPLDGEGKPQSPTVAITRGSTHANRANLPKEFLEDIERAFGGSRLGRQELDGEILDDVDALFRTSWIKHVPVVPRLRKTIIAIDPAITTKGKSDETGIIVIGLGEDGRGYVLADRSGKYSPLVWAQKVVDAYREFGARTVIAETNRGGDMVEHTLRTLEPHLPFKDVHALKGKGLRAEPVAALYEQGRVSHVHGLSKLEDQMVTWDPKADPDSPDRLDALVWGLTELLCHDIAPRFIGNLPHQFQRTQR